jgi:hypothetical protein
MRNYFLAREKDYKHHQFMQTRLLLAILISVSVVGISPELAVASGPVAPVRYTINVGADSGVFVDIMDHKLPNGTFESGGGSEASTIRIRRGDVQIIYDDIWDQPMSPADVVYINAGGNDWNIAVRSGRDKDVLTCYAVRGNVVKLGGRFRFGHHGDGRKNYGFKWENSTTLRVTFGDQTGVIVWDATAQKWNATGEQV